MTDELYERLELDSGASGAEIVHAYRRLAFTAHPDARPEDPEAARRFRELTEAYQVLADPEQRAGYDHQLRQPPAPVDVRRRWSSASASPPWRVGAPVVIVDLGPASVRSQYLRAGPVHIATEAAGSAGGRAAAIVHHPWVLSALLEGWVR